MLQEHEIFSEADAQICTKLAFFFIFILTSYTFVCPFRVSFNGILEKEEDFYRSLPDYQLFALILTIYVAIGSGKF